MDEESILDSVKEFLGIMPEYRHFDSVLIPLINSVFSELNQISSILPEFYIVDENSKWSEYIGDMNSLGLVKPYVSNKVKMNFDAPTNSALTESINRTIDRLEWRISIMDRTYGGC